MRTTLRLAEGWLRWPEGDRPSRPLGKRDSELLRSWTTRYRRGLGACDPEAFLALGREMFAWLDGKEGWIGRTWDEVRPPWIVELAVPGWPGELEAAFLEAGQQVLAQEGPSSGLREVDRALPAVVWNHRRQLRRHHCRWRHRQAVGEPEQAHVGPQQRVVGVNRQSVAVRSWERSFAPSVIEEILSTAGPYCTVPTATATA